MIHGMEGKMRRGLREEYKEMMRRRKRMVGGVEG